DWGRSAPMGHLVNGQPKDVAVDSRHAIHAPVLGVFRNLQVHFAEALDGSPDQASGEDVALRMFFRVERIVVGVQGFFERLPASIPEEQDLESALAGPVAGRHYAKPATVLRDLITCPGAGHAAGWPSRLRSSPPRSPCCRPWRPHGR